MWSIHETFIITTWCAQIKKPIILQFIYSLFMYACKRDLLVSQIVFKIGALENFAKFSEKNSVLERRSSREITAAWKMSTNLNFSNVTLSGKLAFWDCNNVNKSQVSGKSHDELMTSSNTSWTLVLDFAPYSKLRLVTVQMKLTNWQKISMIDSSILISGQNMLSLALWELPRIFMFVWFIICLPKWKVQIYNSAIGTSYLEQ